MPRPTASFTVDVLPEPAAHVVHVYLRDAHGRWLTVAGESPVPAIIAHEAPRPFLTVADEFAPELFAALTSAAEAFATRRLHHAAT